MHTTEIHNTQLQIISTIYTCYVIHTLVLALEIPQSRNIWPR